MTKKRRNGIRKPLPKGFSEKRQELPSQKSSGKSNPIFCFDYHHAHKKFKLSYCDKTKKCEFVKKLDILSQQTWNDIQNAPHEGSGTETIPVSQLDAGIPERIKKIANRILVIRFGGNNGGRIIGFREDRILHIILVDSTLSAYKH